MLVFNCTKAAQDFFTITRKGKKHSIVEAPPCKDMSEDSQHLISQNEKSSHIHQWMVHAVSVKRKHCLVAVEVNTRFSVVMTGLKKADLDEYLNLFKAYLSSQVLECGNDISLWDMSDVKGIIEETISDFEETHFFRRYDPSVQARINSIVQDLRYWVDVDPMILTDENALLNFNWRCNRTYCKSKAYPDKTYITPNEEMLLVWQQLYQGATPQQLATTRQLLRDKMSDLIEGLAGKSSSAPPSQDEPEMIMPSLGPLSSDDLAFLDQTLLKYETELSQENVSSLHGFLTAIVSGPNMLPPSYWLPQVWGGESEQPAWEDMNEAQRFMGALFSMMNDISGTLMDAPMNFSAIFMGDEHHTNVSDWCTGYTDGMELDEEAWSDLPVPLLNQVGFLDEQALMLEVGRKSPHEQAVLNDKVVSAAQALHAYWLKQRSPQPQGAQPRPDNVVQLRPKHPTTGQKVGRNEPCPCGSGKKFKKCCLS